MTDPALPRTPPPAGGSWRRPAPWIGWLTKALLFALLLHGLLYGGAVWTVDRLARILPSPAPGPARAQVRAELLAKPLLPALAAGLEQIGERALALDDLAHQPLACTPFHAAVRVGWSVRSGCFVDPRSGRLFVDMRQLEELLQACAPYGKTAGWYAVGFALAERLQLVGRAPAFRAPPEPEDADQRRLWAGRLLLQREQIAGYLIAPLVEPGAAQLAPPALEQLLRRIDAIAEQRAASSAPNWIEPSRPTFPDEALRARWLARGLDPGATPPTNEIFGLAPEEL